MTVARYLLGVAFLVAMVVPIAYAATGVRAWLLPRWTGAPARLADVVLGIAGLLALAEALGTVGAFRPAPVLVGGAVAGGVAGRRARRAAPGPEHDPTIPPPEPNRPALVLAALTVAVVTAQWTTGVVAAWRTGMLNSDSLWYHLPFSAGFLQDGSITRLHYTVTEPWNTFHPANAELLHAVGLLPFHRDVLSPLVNLAFLGLAFLAAWCVGRPFGRAPECVVAVGILLASPLLRVTQPGQATNDVVGLFFVLAAAALLLTEARPLDSPRLGPVVVAAVAAGLALGTKFSMAPAVVGLTAAVVLLAARARRSTLATAWLVPLVATGGFWYARNLFQSGSPLPYLGLKFGPLSLPSVATPIASAHDFSLLHYTFDPGVWRRAVGPGLRADFGVFWTVVLLLAGAGILVAAALDRDRPWVRVLGVVGAVAVVGYVAMPHSAAGDEGNPWLFTYNVRYFTPALALGLVLLPLWSGPRSPRARWALLAGLGAVLVATLATRRPFPGWPAGPRVVPVAAGLAVLAAAGLATRGRDGARRALGALRAPRPVGIVAVAAGLALLTATGWTLQRRYLADRYAWTDAPSAWRWARSVHGARIAVAGSYLLYPLYGADLSNRVVYVGQRGRRGSFRPYADCRQWRRALVDGRFRYVVASPGGAEQVAPVEAEWTQTDPAARVILSDGPSAVFRIEGRLHPDGCP